MLTAVRTRSNCSLGYIRQPSTAGRPVHSAVTPIIQGDATPQPKTTLGRNATGWVDSVDSEVSNYDPKEVERTYQGAVLPSAGRQL